MAYQCVDKDRIIVRQNALAHADAQIKVESEDDMPRYFEFAEACEKWVTR